MKRILCLVLSLLMVISLVGCSNGDSKTEDEIEINPPTGVPIYDDSLQLEIGAYSMPAKENYDYWDSATGTSDESKKNYASNINEKEFEAYKDAGFTFMLTEYDADYDSSPTRNFTESDLYPVMELAEKLGIGVLVNTSTLTGLTNSGDSRLSEDTQTYLTRLVDSLKDYKCFKGFSLKDEPKIEYAPAVKAVTNFLKELKPDAMFYTSMLPIYASTVSLSAQSNDTDIDAEYADYIDKYLDAINQFDYDFYPLWTENTRKVNYIDTDWYKNLEMVASKVKAKEGAKMGITIQSGSWGKPGMQGTDTQKRTIKTKADIGFQAYSALAYGCKTLCYFTYWLHWGGTADEVFYDAMVMPPETSGGEGVKTDCYYAVQAVNKELQKFDHVLMSFDWQGTYAVAAGNSTKSTLLGHIADYENTRIKSVSATQETIIGCMTDANGYDGFMIVNSTEPSDCKTDEVTITFRKATKALCYINGEEQTIELNEGEYTFKLAEGEGIFVIPIV